MDRKKIEELDKNLRARPVTSSDGLRWLSANDGRFALRGLAWHGENGGRFCRLPLRAEAIVRDPVWQLSQATSSARLAFRSDTTHMAVRVENTSACVMAHMAPTGTSGLSLYAGKPGGMRFWATAQPAPELPAYAGTLVQNLPRKMREFRLYFPLYNGIVSLEVGLSKGARLRPPTPPAVDKPVVFYGTSITQGGCASTSGSDFVSIAGRNLNLDVINLGFSGNGKGEPELADLLTEIDASLYVLDYIANVDLARLRRTLPKFVKVLREKRPDTPILLMTNLCYAQFDFSDQGRQGMEAKRDFTMGFYARARQKGNLDIHLADGFGLMPFGADAVTVDGCHPSSHGFHMIAERLAPAIEAILLRDN